MKFSKDILTLENPEAICQSMGDTIKEITFKKFRKKGVIVAISGGIDSSVCAALCAKILGPKRVLGLILPEQDSDPGSEALALELVEKTGIQVITENITDTLNSFGCYKRRDEAIKTIFPDYTSEWKQKIILPQNLLETSRLNFYSVVVEDPQGNRYQKRLTLKAFLQIVAAVNFKQRTRKIFEYYHADRLNYAVIGTPNLLEYDQGFFVKQGDGAADIKPIAKLYKTQVYQLGHYLNVPEKILSSRPTTDTYSLPQSQEEFYFALPYEKMDLMLYAYINKVPIEEVSQVMELRPEQIEWVFKDIEQKRRTTSYLHHPPILVDPFDN